MIRYDLEDDDKIEEKNDEEKVETNDDEEELDNIERMRRRNLILF